MELAGRFARRIESIIDRIVGIGIILIILMASYSLWNSLMLYRGGFAGDELLKYKPVSDGRDNPSLYDLMKINKDVIAWIEVDDTHIDQPVVQGKSNMEYVNKDVYGDFKLSGSIFLDQRNDKSFKDPYSLLYGHHMEGGGMFGDLLKFEDKTFFDSHKTGKLYLPDTSYELEIFMVAKADAYDGVIFNPTSIKSPSEIIDYAKASVINQRDIDLGSDRILAMSTCEKAVSNGRTIVFAAIREVGFEKN